MIQYIGLQEQQVVWHCDDIAMTLRCKALALEWHRCSKTHELSIDQWMSCHSHYQTSQREGREREVRLLWYPRYCSVQTLHNISLALVCWVIAASNHQNLWRYCKSFLMSYLFGFFEFTVQLCYLLGYQYQIFCFLLLWWSLGLC